MNKKNKKKYKTSVKDNENYMRVLSALAFVFEKEKEEENRRITRIKVRIVLNWFTVVGAVIIFALSFISTFSFDVSWMSDVKKWYSDIYISFTTYVVITDIVLVLERNFKMDQKPAFGYAWPFIAFALSLFLTNTVHVEIQTGELRTNIALFLIVLAPSIIIMVDAYKTGINRGKREASLAKKASKIINDNPEMVDAILNDYDNYLNNPKE